MNMSRQQHCPQQGNTRGFCREGAFGSAQRKIAVAFLAGGISMGGCNRVEESGAPVTSATSSVQVEPVTQESEDRERAGFAQLDSLLGSEQVPSMPFKSYDQAREGIQERRRQSDQDVLSLLQRQEPETRGFLGENGQSLGDRLRIEMSERSDRSLIELRKEGAQLQQESQSDLNNDLQGLHEGWKYSRDTREAKKEEPKRNTTHAKPPLDSRAKAEGPTYDSLIPSDEPKRNIQNAVKRNQSKRESYELHPAEIEDYHNQRLINALLPDGARALTTGYQYVERDQLNNDILLVLGTRTRPEQAQAHAESLAQVTGRPVTSILNHSGLQAGDSYVKFQVELDESLKLPGRNFLAQKYELEAEVFGSILDAAATVAGRFLPGGEHLEPSVATLTDEILRRLEQGRNVDLVVHSQGSVIAQLSLEMVNQVLLRREEMNQIDEAERKNLLSRIHVYAAGAFANKEQWIEGISLTPLDHDDDIISLLGGNVPIENLGEVDYSLESHDFSGYLKEIAREIENNDKDE